MTGKVYFVAAPGRVKIGFTHRPEKRLVDLQRVDMEKLSVIAIVDGSRFLEKTLHNLLKLHRLRGEWFVDCPEVRAEIDSAIAGRYPLEKHVQVFTEPFAEMAPDEERPFSPQYQIVAKLSDEVEAAIARNADKYEIRGYVHAFLAATEMYLQQRQIDQRNH